MIVHDDPPRRWPGVLGAVCGAALVAWFAYPSAPPHADAPAPAVVARGGETLPPEIGTDPYGVRNWPSGSMPRLAVPAAPPAPPPQPEPAAPGMLPTMPDSMLTPMPAPRTAPEAQTEPEHTPG